MAPQMTLKLQKFQTQVPQLNANLFHIRLNFTSVAQQKENTKEKP